MAHGLQYLQIVWPVMVLPADRQSQLGAEYSVVVQQSASAEPDVSAIAAPVNAGVRMIVFGCK